jgi:hypothetical protein
MKSGTHIDGRTHVHTQEHPHTPVTLYTSLFCSDGRGAEAISASLLLNPKQLPQVSDNLPFHVLHKPLPEFDMVLLSWVLVCFQETAPPNEQRSGLLLHYHVNSWFVLEPLALSL